MADRRRRVIASARDVLADGGVAGVSMEEVGRRARTSTRALYNMFSSPRALIGLVIEESFARDVAELALDAPETTLARIVERICKSLDQSEGLLCMRTAAELYARHDGTLPPLVEAYIRDQYVRWLEALSAKGKLRPWVDIGTTADSLMRHELMTINDWANGRIAGPISAIVIERLLPFILGLAEDSGQDCMEQLLRDTISVYAPKAALA